MKGCQVMQRVHEGSNGALCPRRCSAVHDHHWAFSCGQSLHPVVTLISIPSASNAYTNCSVVSMCLSICPVYMHVYCYCKSVHASTLLSLNACETMMQTDPNMWLVYHKSGHRQFAVFFSKALNLFEVCGTTMHIRRSVMWYCV